MKVCKADWLESINVTDMDKLNTICVGKCDGLLFTLITHVNEKS